LNDYANSIRDPLEQNHQGENGKGYRRETAEVVAALQLALSAVGKTAQ
jgi:hypothetical protein